MLAPNACRKSVHEMMMRVEGAPGADGPSAPRVFTAEILWLVWPETFPSAICTLEGCFPQGFVSLLKIYCIYYSLKRGRVVYI